MHLHIILRKIIHYHHRNRNCEEIHFNSYILVSGCTFDFRLIFIVYEWAHLQYAIETVFMTNIWIFNTEILAIIAVIWLWISIENDFRCFDHVCVSHWDRSVFFRFKCSYKLIELNSLTMKMNHVTMKCTLYRSEDKEEEKQIQEVFFFL